MAEDQCDSAALSTVIVGGGDERHMDHGPHFQIQKIFLDLKLAIASKHFSTINALFSGPSRLSK